MKKANLFPRVVVRLLILGGMVSVLTGCSFSRFARDEDELLNRIDLEMGISGGFKISQWDTKFGDEQRFVPYHPSEAPAGSGGVYLEPDGIVAPFHLEGHVGAGIDPVTLYAGLDLRFNQATIFDIAGGIWERMISEPYQGWDDSVIDTEDLSYGGSDTEAYTIFTPDETTILPLIGLRWAVSDNFHTSFEYGRPHGQFTYETGYYRNDHLEPYFRDDWSGWGHMFGIRLAYVDDKDQRIGFEYRRERYSADFGGTDVGLRSNVFSIFFEWSL